MSELPDRAWMTPLLNRIADVAGDEAALKLGYEKACRQIYIPEIVTEDHWLAEMIGLDAARAMSEEFGGNHITMPPVLAGSKRARAKAIRELSEQGLSLNEVAAMVGVARSTVIEHRAKLGNRAKPSNDDQGSLF